MTIEYGYKVLRPEILGTVTVIKPRRLDVVMAWLYDKLELLQIAFWFAVSITAFRHAF